MTDKPHNLQAINVERLLNRALGPDWEQSHEEAFAAGVEHARASLSSELARCRSALEEVEYTISAWALAHDIDGAARNDLLKRLRESQSNASDAALNPIGEEGAREP
jgi:hypothetical protein